jgi:hypothetical protein
MTHLMLPDRQRRHATSIRAIVSDVARYLNNPA